MIDIQVATVTPIDAECCHLPDRVIGETYEVHSVESDQIYFLDDDGEAWYGCSYCLDINGMIVAVEDCADADGGLYTVLMPYINEYYALTDGTDVVDVHEKHILFGKIKEVVNVLPATARIIEEYKALKKVVAPIDIRWLDAEVHKDRMVFGAKLRHALLASESLRKKRELGHSRAVIEELILRSV